MGVFDIKGRGKGNSTALSPKAQVLIVLLLGRLGSGIFMMHFGDVGFRLQADVWLSHPPTATDIVMATTAATGFDGY